MILGFYLREVESRAVGILFLINASVIGNWLVRIPDLKRDLALSDGQLGLALLASPVGVLTFTPIATWCINRFGVGKVVVFAAGLMLVSTVGLGQVLSLSQFIIALYFFGAFNGVLDISMNGVANVVEKRLSRVVMSTSHGFWSLGAMIASFIGGLVISWGVHYDLHFILVGAVGMLLLGYVSGTVWNIRDEAEDAFHWRWPGWSLIIISSIALIILMVEGAIADWSALFFEEILSSPVEMIGWGFAGFSGAMAVARFWGDKIIEKFSLRPILVVSAMVACLGLLVFSTGHSVLVCCLAMICAGLGCAVIVPILFREAGKSKKVNPSLGLAIVSTIGYSGFLIGPPMMGFISEKFNLTYSFLSLAFLMILVFLLSWRLK